MTLIRQFAIRNKLLYSDVVLPNVQIFFVPKISFATFGVSIDDIFTRYAGLGYSLNTYFGFFETTSWPPGPIILVTATNSIMYNTFI